MSFNGKVVLIILTGTSIEIVADIARYFASLNANVSIAGRNKKCLYKIAESIVNSDSSAPLIIVADVTKDAERIVDETINSFGKLNVLVNNAEIVVRDNALKVIPYDFDHVIDVNVRSVIALTKLCIPHLEKTEGNIINISSIAASSPMPHFITYCMSKAALNQFTKCCALDLASKKIRVNAINTDAIRSPIVETFGLNPEQTEKMLLEYKKKYPVDRIGDVYNISATVAYLADDEMCLHTGISLPIVEIGIEKQNNFNQLCYPSQPFNTVIQQKQLFEI